MRTKHNLLAIIAIISVAALALSIVAFERSAAAAAPPHGSAVADQPTGPTNAPQQATMPGQEAFGTIGEIVSILQSYPSTDWSNVNISALREHLIDMNVVTMDSIVSERDLDGAVEFVATGDARTLEGLKRMVPMHTDMILSTVPWMNASYHIDSDSVTLRIEGDTQRAHALGFIGIMTIDSAHHPVHHMMIARGILHR